MNTPFAPYIPVTLLLLLLATVIVFCARRSRRRLDAAVRAAYGSVPQGNPEDVESARAYHLYAAKEDGDGAWLIDDTTWNDLNMDDVFRRVNGCHTSIGEECLYRALHTLGGAGISEALIKWLDEREDCRVALQKSLIGIGKCANNRLSAYLFYADAKKMPRAYLYVLMALMPLVGASCFAFSSALGLVVTLAAFACNMAVYSVKRMAWESELDSLRYFASMLHGAKEIQRTQGKALKERGVDLEPILRLFRRLGGMIPGVAKQAMSDLESLVIVFKALFLIDFIQYNHIVNVMRRHRRALRGLYEMIGGLDCAVCVASFRKSLPFWCAPEFVERNVFHFAKAYHPLLKHPVANTADIDSDSIVTGSNASGKSTFIKTLAVNHIFAQTLHTCCAERYALCACHVATSMALRDDILSGDSYFITEIKSLKRLIDLSRTRRCALFIDEILRGTNTPERIAASVAVLKMLKETDSLVMVASHDIELTEILSGIYDNYHFCETFENDRITFDYTLKNGASATANALRLLEHMGFDEQIIRDAQKMIEAKENVAAVNILRNAAGRAGERSAPLH